MNWRRRLWAWLFPRWFVVRGEPTRREVGELGERAARRHLRRLGWRILGRNVLSSAGEVDIVALDAGELVCVEVKTARVADSRCTQRPEFRPGRHFDARRLGRQRRAATELGRELAVSGRGRVDLLEVVLDGRTGRAYCTLNRDMDSAFAVRR